MPNSRLILALPVVVANQILSVLFMLLDDIPELVSSFPTLGVSPLLHIAVLPKLQIVKICLSEQGDCSRRYRKTG